ncbi:hypothetical protein HanRHA438_Chr07g0320841 [Helianthus annuus]|nr:hypothetical protein HanRHA438_Chr07g0320841 [Helianthus annuus]
MNAFLISLSLSPCGSAIAMVGKRESLKKTDESMKKINSSTYSTGIERGKIKI